MGYSIDSSDSNCYEGTTCLINKFNITDEKILSSLEADITFAKASALENNPICKTFDFEHYKAIHKYLFEELYDWAGQIRTINISKKGTEFVSAKEIEAIANNCFDRLKRENYFRDLPIEQFIDCITEFYCTTNILHPFREGNGRTQRIFIAQLIHFCGYDFDFSDINSDELMIATIQSANGVSEFLKDLFRKNIHKKDSIR